MIRAVILDLDDTLFPEAEYVKSGFCAVSEFLKATNSITNAFEKIFKLYQENEEKVFNRFCACEGLDEKYAGRLHEVYISHKPDISLYPDSFGFLECCKSRGKKLGLITDGRPVQQHAKIDALGICSFFDRIIVTDELGGVMFRKPCSKAFEILSEEFKIPYEEMIYIGDNPRKDFAVKKVLPVKTAQILRTDAIYSQEDYLDGVLPDFKTESLNQLNII